MRRLTIGVLAAATLAGCGGARPDGVFSLPLYEELPAPVTPTAPIDVASASKPTPKPPVGPSAPPDGNSGGTGGSGGGGSSGPAPTPTPSPSPSPGEVGLTLTTGDAYRLARVAGDAIGGIALGSDGPSARFNAVAGMVVAPDGTIYAADPLSHQVREIPTSGPTRVVAGDVGGAGGFYGDNVPAVGTRLNGPTGLARDPGTGAIFVADTGNARIRVFTPGGRIYTFAGGGFLTTDTVASAGTAVLQQPCGLAVDNQQRLYFSDRGNNKLRRVEANSQLNTVATFTAAIGAIACDATGARVWVAEGPRVWQVNPGQTPAIVATPVFQLAGAQVMGLATDQAGSLYVLAAAASPLGRQDTHVWRVSTETAGRPPVRVAGKDGAGATPADFTAPAAGVPDAVDQWLAAGGVCGLAIDISRASDPDVVSGVLYQANTYNDGAGTRWGQINRLTPAP